ncbi:hypothetical protein [Uliginosibacterium sp. H1]|uniref:hypothetical protein n=1 Tax=Uliginosibacterium sp. H1 TaxID=3114757 RepID=UPI002E1768DA|nr:hypothetical protein [Uliginosibacterium sp. H1]
MSPRLPSWWMHDSGGLRYHLRALRYRGRLWRDFIDSLGAWQESWHPPLQRLVVIGPSAGYCLSAALLTRFEEVVALEPDRLARSLLPRRFRGVRWRFDDLDCFAPGGLKALAWRYPDAALLFANVIGQRTDDTNADELRGNLRDQLADHHWASWHDVVSTARKPDQQLTARLSQDLPLESLLARFWRGGELPLVDHHTYRLMAGTAQYALWPLTPRQHHLIEWSVHAPAARQTHAPDS